eukprot:322557-Prorocentrum_minimum.AAC.1
MLNIIHYSRYTEILGKGRRTEQALELLAEMRREGVQPGTITYSALISACEKGNQWERVLELLVEMRREG